MVNVSKSSEPSDCLMVLAAHHGVVLPKSSESSDCLMVLPACRLPMVIVPRFIVPKSSESSGSSYPSRRRDAPPWSSSCRSIHRHPRAPYCHRCKAGGTLFSGARRTGGSADSRRSRTPHDVVVMASASEFRRLPITPMVPRWPGRHSYAAVVAGSDTDGVTMLPHVPKPAPQVAAARCPVAARSPNNLDDNIGVSTGANGCRMDAAKVIGLYKGSVGAVASSVVGLKAGVIGATLLPS